MPRTRTTWGKGQGGKTGRPRGAKDKFPRSGRSAVNALLEKYGTNTDLLDKALFAGLTAPPGTSFPWFRLVIEQHAGMPEQSVAVVTKVVHEIHES